MGCPFSPLPCCTFIPARHATLFYRRFSFLLFFTHSSFIGSSGIFLLPHFEQLLHEEGSVRLLTLPRRKKKAHIFSLSPSDGFPNLVSGPSLASHIIRPSWTLSSNTATAGLCALPTLTSGFMEAEPIFCPATHWFVGCPSVLPWVQKSSPAQAFFLLLPLPGFETWTAFACRPLYSFSILCFNLFLMGTPASQEAHL